jgi:hypothetical protein
VQAKITEDKEDTFDDSEYEPTPDKWGLLYHESDDTNNGEVEGDKGAPTPHKELPRKNTEPTMTNIDKVYNDCSD